MTKSRDSSLIQTLNNFTDGAYISDSQYSFHYVSPSLQKLFGNPYKKKCFKYLFGRENICPWCKNDEVFSGKVVSWEQRFDDIEKTFIILEAPLYYPGKEIKKITIYRDITHSKRVEEKLTQININLIEEQVKLKRKNVALKEILNQYESEKKLIGRQIQANISRFILPILGDIENGATENQKILTKTLKESLIDITSPFINQLENKYSNLSPRESEICKLINEEYSSKEIASLLGLSVQTIHVRRKHIRKKLGITNREINLSVHLKSI